jgi:hypothetical protein
MVCESTWSWGHPSGAGFPGWRISFLRLVRCKRTDLAAGGYKLAPNVATDGVIRCRVDARKMATAHTIPVTSLGCVPVY